jgi:excisionase family DNA binding protein
MKASAEGIYKDIVSLPIAERERLFSLIARKGFDRDEYTYEEVFGNIPATLTIRESAEYLEVAEVTVRRWAKEGKLPFHKIGKNYVFATDDLRKVKRKSLSRS